MQNTSTKRTEKTTKTHRDHPGDFGRSRESGIEIANNSDFDWVTLNVLAIPRCSSEAAQAFVDWKHTYSWQIHQSLPSAD